MSRLRCLITNAFVPAILTGFLCLVFLSVIPPSAAAAPSPEDTPTPTPSPTPTPPADSTLEDLDRRIKELEKLSTIATKQKEIAESEAALATAEKNKILNLLPTPTATPLAGTTTVEGQVVFQSELLAYKSLADIAGGLGADMQGLSGTVVIHNDADINALQAYAVMLAQVKTIVDQYKDLNHRLSPGSPEEVGAALFAAPQVVSTLLRSAADIAALFRTNTTITGLTFTVDDAALNAQVAAALRQKGLNVFEPKLYLPNLFSHPDSEIIKQLGTLNQLKTRGDQAVAEFEALSDAQKNAGANAAKKVVIPRIKALNTQVDAFIANLMRADETTKQSPLTGLYRAEKLKSLLGNGEQQTYVLHLKLASAEGTRTTKTNLFTGTKLSHAGGMILAYTLFDRNGQIVKSGILAAYRGSSKSKPQDDVLLKLP